jgi:retron-type reverse transcriptase
MLMKEKLRISRLIIDLINETITGNSFPSVLKRARVIPIFKKGDPTNLNNYRPISLLPVLSKVLEKLINKQITDKLDEKMIIDENQYGFRTGHSTEDAVVKFIDMIEKLKLKNIYEVSIHIDVSKAFDSCDHGIIKSKLQRIGLDGKSLELITSYYQSSFSPNSTHLYTSLSL